MNTTSPSLLDRLHQPGEQDAWGHFVQLYTPLLYSWARGLGLQHPDAADLVQDIFTLLVQKLPEFKYDPQKSFRSWLRTVALNKWRDWGRRLRPAVLEPNHEAFAELTAPEDSQAFPEAEYRQHLISRALQLMQAELSPTMWKACWEHVVAGRPAAAVAAELGISAGSVYVAKSRVLCRLRQELQGLLD
jgi:RNA polymerase sigma-70 factor (ECF subfamily)